MNQPVYNLRPRDNSAIPNVIFALLIANGLMFAVQQFNMPFTRYYLALWSITDAPTATYAEFIQYWLRDRIVPAPFAPWQLVTYAFLHGDLMHIFFNMFGLWMFGRDLERLMGAKRFLIYFFTCSIGAGIVQLIVATTQGAPYPTVGASGGVFGILLAYGLTYPNRMVMLLFPPIPMRAKYFVLFYGLLELYLGVSGGAPRVAHFAHLGGMAFGFVLLRYWTRPRRRG
jgi:membrane associated rhomboid family serine protease